MTSTKKSKGDPANLHSFSPNNNVQGLDSSYRVELREGDQAYPYYPFKDRSRDPVRVYAQPRSG